jgi:putative ABC transport system substrate-binding protein
MAELTAQHVDKIFKGTPAEIPIQQPTVFELALSLKTAAALGISVRRGPHRPGDRMKRRDV